MARPLLPSLILHGIAFSIGLGGAAILLRSQPNSPTPHSESQQKASHRRDRSNDSMHLSSPSSFHAAYESLIHRPMTEDDRSYCIQTLWEQWAASDPAGLLAFLEKKPIWPKDLRIGYLLSDHPDLLLPFALRQGSSDAIEGLYNSDAPTVARLLADLPEEHKGTEIHKLEKQIARNLGNQGIPQETPSPAYLFGVAKSLLEAGRIDEFIETFQQVGDPEEMRDLAREFGDALREEKQSDKEFELFLRLPEEYRKDAASRLVYGQPLSFKFPEARQVQIQWLEKFAAAGFIDEAASGVSLLFRDEEASLTTEEIAAWVTRFPQDGSWQPITVAIIRSWHEYGLSLTTMVAQIANLPEGPAREAIATEAYDRFLPRLDPFIAEDQLIRDRLTALFNDPAAKERFEKRFLQNEDPADPFAPTENLFGPTSDPFAPTVDPFKK